MQKTILIIVLTLSLFACNNESGYQKGEDAQDAGTEFIRASLDGNYKKALFYLYKDSTDTNVMLLNKWENNYTHLKEEEKTGYKDANIIAIRIDQLNDSTVNYIYTNSYNLKDTTTIKVIRIKNEWLVDLKYSITHN